jgi:RNA polymerase II subunit A small phosphatase-like protein
MSAKVISCYPINDAISSINKNDPYFSRAQRFVPFQKKVRHADTTEIITQSTTQLGQKCNTTYETTIPLGHNDSFASKKLLFPSLVTQFLLPPQSEQYIGRKTIVLDLDETLVHSSFKPTPNCDLIVPVHLDGVTYNAYVNVRPYANTVLSELIKFYEVIIFTASIRQYAEAVINTLDPLHLTQRLFRESCTIVPAVPSIGRHYLKDLRRLGRDLKQTLIIDNSPVCVALQPENGILVTTWTDSRDDIELLQLQDILLCDKFLASPDLPETLRNTGMGR